jgi:hypothetical protein
MAEMVRSNGGRAFRAETRERLLSKGEDIEVIVSCGTIFVGAVGATNFARVPMMLWGSGAPRSRNRFGTVLSDVSNAVSRVDRSAFYESGSAALSLFSMRFMTCRHAVHYPTII